MNITGLDLSSAFLSPMTPQEFLHVLFHETGSTPHSNLIPNGPLSHQQWVRVSVRVLDLSQRLRSQSGSQQPAVMVEWVRGFLSDGGVGLSGWFYWLDLLFGGVLFCA